MEKNESNTYFGPRTNQIERDVKNGCWVSGLNSRVDRDGIYSVGYRIKGHVLKYWTY